MGFTVEYWSLCNEKFTSILKSTSLSLLLTTLIFLSASSAPSEEPRRCYWCGPLAEQVHRSRRARPCAAPLQETVCEEPHRYCATVALAPPYTESRLCVKIYQDECYPVYCNTTRTYKMTCPCRGDFCNGPNTPREEAAFSQLRNLAASRKTKRSIQEEPNTTHEPVNRIDDPISDRSSVAPDYADDRFATVTSRRDSDYESISTLNNSEKGEDSEINGVSSLKTHNPIVNESDNNHETDANKELHETTDTVETTSQTERGSTGDAQSIVTVATVTQTPSKTHTMMTPKNPKDGDDNQIDNEIPKDRCPASTELNSLVSTENPKLEAPLAIEETNDDSVRDHDPTVKVPIETVNEVYASSTSNKPSEFNANNDDVDASSNDNPKTHIDITEGHQNGLTTEMPNHDLRENNEEPTHGTSEAPRDDISVTKVMDQDTNLINTHSIEILDQKIETTAGEVDTNFNDTCNQTNTCSVSGAHNESTEKPDSDATQKPMVTLYTTSKSPKPTEEIVHSNAITEIENTRSILTTLANPAEAMTTVSSTLSSKVKQTTETTLNSGIKMSKQTKEKNSAFTVSGSFILLTNAFLVVLAL